MKILQPGIVMKNKTLLEFALIKLLPYRIKCNPLPSLKHELKEEEEEEVKVIVRLFESAPYRQHVVLMGFISLYYSTRV